MKSKIIVIAFTLFFISTIITAQKNNTADSDSVTLQSYQQQKEQLVKKIVQVQSDLYELKEQREKHYNELSQLNIAIMFTEEKLKNKKQIGK